jgi:hypothetical protein
MKKSNEKSTFQRKHPNECRNATSVSGIAIPEMPLDQTNSSLETEASGF